MAAAKKKPKPRPRPKIQASDVVVENRTLLGVLRDMAEQSKVNAARSARAEEMATIALQTIASVTQDLRAFTLEMRAFAGRTNDRLDALEKPTAAE